jgi:hypothetical protein
MSTPIKFRVRCSKKLHSITVVPRGRITLHNHSKEELQAHKALGVECGCVKAKLKVIFLSGALMTNRSVHYSPPNPGLTFGIYRFICNNFQAKEHERSIRRDNVYIQTMPIKQPPPALRKDNIRLGLEGVVAWEPINLPQKSGVVWSRTFERAYFMGRLADGFYEGMWPAVVDKGKLVEGGRIFQVTFYHAVSGPSPHWRVRSNEKSIFLTDVNQVTKKFFLPFDRGIHPISH